MTGVQTCALPISGVSLCADASQYFFWDGVHPTTNVAKLIGIGLASAAPEPSAMLLLAAAALALVGVGRKRRA